MKSHNVLVLALLAGVTGCQKPAGDQAANVASATQPANAGIIAAAEPFEVLTEEAAGADWPKIDTLAATASSAAAAVRAKLPAASAARLDKQLAAIQQARGSRDRLGMALAAVEGYRTIVEAQDPASAKPPIPVSLLDYAGFRYDALTRAPNVDWRQVAESAAFASEQWTVLKPQIKSVAVAGLVEAALAAMVDAAKRKDTAYAQGAAATELALVDVLEEDVQR